MTTDITNLAIRRTESYSGDVEHDDVLGVITGHPQDRILLRRCLGRCGAGQNPIAPVRRTESYRGQLIESFPNWHPVYPQYPQLADC